MNRIPWLLGATIILSILACGGGISPSLTYPGDTDTLSGGQVTFSWSSLEATIT